MQREKDLVREAELYIQRWPQIRIAEEMGVTQQQISNDLKEIRRRWREDQVSQIDEYKSRLLAQLDEIERNLWKSWVASVEDKKYPGGYIAYMDKLLDCIDKRAKILELYAPTKQKLEVDHKGEKPMTEEEMIKYIEEKVYGLFPEARENKDTES